MSKITSEQMEYAIDVLGTQLQVDCGKYVSQEMLKVQSDAGDPLATLFGGLMGDSSVDDNVHALSNVIHVLRKLQGELAASEAEKEKK